MWSFAFVITLTAHLTNGLTRQERQSQRSWLANPPPDNKEILNYFSKQLMEDDDHFNRTLAKFLRVRTPGSPGNTFVRQMITDELRQLGWTVEFDSFQDRVPGGRSLPFTNVIATLNPSAPRRLVLACHHDSKTLPKGFLGATDSAVPCTMLLNIAKIMHLDLKNHREKPFQDVTLQYAFFDGEEPIDQWRGTDNTYGSRHLASLWERNNKLEGIDALVLLDLLGAKNPKITSLDPATDAWHKKLARIEKAIKNIYKSLPRSVIFQSQAARNNFIEDDHIPFMRRGVPVLHLIDRDFLSATSGWHTLNDNIDIIDRRTVELFNKIIRVFIAEYLGLYI